MSIYDVPVQYKGVEAVGSEMQMVQQLEGGVPSDLAIERLLNQVGDLRLEGVEVAQEYDVDDLLCNVVGRFGDWLLLLRVRVSKKVYKQTGKTVRPTLNGTHNI
jgi:hypothetical protein